MQSPRKNGVDLSSRWTREQALAALRGSPREVLARLGAGDPLGARAALAELSRTDALLLDGDAALVRTWVHCAREAPTYTGRPPLAEWVAERAREAVRELTEEIHEAAIPGTPTPPALDGTRALADGLGWDASRAAAVLDAFAHRPLEERRAYWDLVVESRDPEEAAARAGASLPTVARRARSCLQALTAATRSSPSTTPAPPTTPGRSSGT